MVTWQGDGAEFATSMEYMVTPENGECVYNEQTVLSNLSSPEDYVLDMTRRASPRPPGITFTNLTRPSMPGLANDSYRTLMIAMSGNAR